MASWSLLLLGLFVTIGIVGSAAFVQDPNNVQIGYHPADLVSSAAAIEPNGLELVVSLNATALQTGQSANISLQESNTRSEYNNVTVSNDWAVQGLSDGPCGVLNSPIGYSVYTGYYTSANITSAKAIQLYAPGPYACPMILSSISAYGFHSMSSTADVYASCSPMLCFTEQISSTGVVRGYWTDGSSDLLGGGTFHELNAGVYTVVAGDEWGGTAFVYFVVN